MLEKIFDPKNVEKTLYKKWEDNGYFKPSGNKEAFSVVLPPPNVTGNLHMGHALNNTMQDILVRYQRMLGKNTLWLPGTDHAGIATQMVVERQLDAKGIKRHDLGREGFLEKVWEWKEKSGDQITHQQRRLGNSSDWSRSRFTMDDGMSQAVQKAFVQLHRDGLIYRDKRLVNWDPKLETAISDLEVIQKEVNGHMWYVKYPVVGSEGEYITVGTTRPETMLGDTGVAVHPDDERYTKLIGKMCVQPLTGREIPIVSDIYPDPEQGTGAVKITPAHDFNDYEVGKRCNLEKINIMTPQGTMNENCPEKYQGMNRFDCREVVIADMTALGFFVKVEDHVHTVPYGDRGGVPIEPYLTDQWYVDAKTLAKPAIEAVESGRTKFVPENWTKTYFDWMYNIQPWCISRQLWWGHRIPAWYGHDGMIFVQHSEAEALAKAKEHYGKDVELTRDEDVLDTWFSSALWPFSTLGWPEKTQDLEDFYQTDVLVTGFDIIFFWVARMMMFGMHFMKKEPFHTVVVHALVLDEHGAKMSKSKGNVVDPLKLVDEYGTDSMRFTLASLATPGKDIKFSIPRVEGNRNLMTKIWNAAKFCEMNQAIAPKDFDINSPKSATNRWIIAELSKSKTDLESALNAYRFSDSANVLYHFVRGTFCDWYVELSKPLFWSEDESILEETRNTAGWVFQQILRLMHPITPFMTEQLWKEFGTDTLLIAEKWVELDTSKIDIDAQAEMDWVIRLITSIRSARSEMNVPAGNEVDLHFMDISDENKLRLNSNDALIKRLAKTGMLSFVESETPGSAQFLQDEATVFMPLGEAIDVEAEITRLTKNLKKAEGESKKFCGKLASEGYLKQAPDHIIEKDKASLLEANNTIVKTKQAIERLRDI